jgi:hypothetical protein
MFFEGPERQTKNRMNVRSKNLKVTDSRNSRLTDRQGLKMVHAQSARRWERILFLSPAYVSGPHLTRRVPTFMAVVRRHLKRSAPRCETVLSLFGGKVLPSVRKGCQPSYQANSQVKCSY